MFEEYIEILSKTPLFKGIEKNEISTMLGCIKPKVSNYNKNDYIIISGAVFENIGIILSGEATVSKETAAGNRTLMTVIHKGDIFGEMIAFSSRTTWPATVKAQEDCVVFFLPRGKIVGECDKMCPWHRVLINNFLRIISEKALMVNKKVDYLTIKSMQGKISTYLLEQYKITGEKNIILPLKRNELADFLNVSRPSMSREMCKMRDEGIIDFHLTTFRILDLEALKAMSDL
jgi:CRP/FNR family transcriptional regulator, dissimilatory nitrate respiration regulator